MIECVFLQTFGKQWIVLTLLISILALLGTFYQLHLQRVHNEKSLKPLGQITLRDHGNVVAVHLCNNGLGPMIVDRLSFKKGDMIHSKITDCLDLDPRSYMHVAMDDLAERVILPAAHLTLFEKDFSDQKEALNIDRTRSELSAIRLTVSCRDIYDNTFTIERDFKWFSRHLIEEVD